MNFPVGSVLFKGECPFDLSERALELSEKKFNGYLVLSVRGSFVEEGVLFFREGDVVACVVECLSLQRTEKGDNAVEFFVNQTKGSGFFQCVELTRSQVDLVTAFDEKLLTSKINLKDLAKLIPSAFSPKFEKPEEKVDMLSVHGLGELK